MRITGRVGLGLDDILPAQQADILVPAKYEADQLGAKINAVQKEIGQRKKARA